MMTPTEIPKKDFGVVLTNASARDRSKTDFYATPRDCAVVLLDFLAQKELLKCNSTVWEPACGDGAITRVLVEYGCRVRETDLALGTDFLKESYCDYEWIITNPPFSLSEDFVHHSARLCHKFAFLLKSQYFHAGRRVKLFDKFPPAFILPMCWRPDFLFGSKSGSPTMDVLWAVWLHPHVSDTIYRPLRRPVASNLKTEVTDTAELFN